MPHLTTPPVLLCTIRTSPQTTPQARRTLQYCLIVRLSGEKCKGKITFATPRQDCGQRRGCRCERSMPTRVGMAPSPVHAWASITLTLGGRSDTIHNGGGACGPRVTEARIRRPGMKSKRKRTKRVHVKTITGGSESQPHVPYCRDNNAVVLGSACQRVSRLGG